MSFGVNPTASALNSLAQYQTKLGNLFTQASSGKALTSAASNPAGLAIYNALQTQATGFDQGSANITDASNAINVAQGALANTTGALQQLNTLAIQAGNDFLSTSDRQALQAEANQLVGQINSNAQSANFNGTQLLTGQFSGTTPGAAATATTSYNDVLANGNSVVSSATASGATQSGTVNVQVVSTGLGTAGAQLTFTDSATGATTNIGTVAAGSTTNVNGTSVTVGNFSSSDIGTSATIQATATQAGSANPTLNVQGGATAGSITAAALPNATTSGLFIQNIDLSSSANASNAQGQIASALAAVGTASAQLGAQSNALAVQQQNNNTSSLNLTSSASAIGDANAAGVASELNSLLLQQQVSIATINNANVTYGYLNRFLNIGA